MIFDLASLDGGVAQGDVHDPTARLLGGIAGNAGLFSTVADLERFAQAMLGGGQLGTARILVPESVREMVTVTAGQPHGLGWMIDQMVNQSSFMGRLGEEWAWGRTGYTATSLVVSPKRGLVVILLTNRVHPLSKGPSTLIQPVRRAVADAALRLFGPQRD